MGKVCCFEDAEMDIINVVAGFGDVTKVALPNASSASLKHELVVMIGGLGRIAGRS